MPVVVALVRRGDGEKFGGFLWLEKDGLCELHGGGLRIAVVGLVLVPFIFGRCGMLGYVWWAVGNVHAL